MAAYREVSFAVPNDLHQYCESDGSDRDTAAGVDRDDTENAEEGESHHTTDPVPLLRRLSTQFQQNTDSADEGGSYPTADVVPQPRRRSTQSRQSTESAEEGESHPTADPVPQPRRRSKQSRQSLVSAEEAEHHPAVLQPRRRSKQSRQSLVSAEEAEDHPAVDPDPDQLSAGQPLQRDLGGIASDHDTPSSKRKKPRLSDSTEPESTEGVPASSSSSKSAVRQGFWTAAMVSLCKLIHMLACTYVLCTSFVYYGTGCTPQRGGGAAQGRWLGEGGGVHGGRVNCWAV